MSPCCGTETASTRTLRAWEAPVFRKNTGRSPTQLFLAFQGRRSLLNSRITAGAFVGIGGLKSSVPNEAVGDGISPRNKLSTPSSLCSSLRARFHRKKARAAIAKNMKPHTGPPKRNPAAIPTAATPTVNQYADLATAHTPALMVKKLIFAAKEGEFTDRRLMPLPAHSTSADLQASPFQAGR
jgi:hypothetical protein